METFLRGRKVNIDTAIRALERDENACHLDYDGNLFSLSGGNYRVSDYDRDEFIRRYVQSLYQQNHRPAVTRHLTERPRLSAKEILQGFGPMVFDFDFHYDASLVPMPADGTTPPSMMTPAVTQELVAWIMRGMREFVVREDTFDVHYAIFTQPFIHMNSPTDMKDGVHIMIFTQMSVPHQRLFRETMLREERFSRDLDEWRLTHGLPIRRNMEGVVDWDEVYDQAVASGGNWMPWKSCKPGREPYRIQRIAQYAVYPEGADDTQIVTPEVIDQLESLHPESMEMVIDFVTQTSVRTVPEQTLPFQVGFHSAGFGLYDAFQKNNYRFQRSEVKLRLPNSTTTVVNGLRAAADARLLSMHHGKMDPRDAEHLETLMCELQHIVNNLVRWRETGLQKLRHLWTALLQPEHNASEPVLTEVAKLTRFWNMNYFPPDADDDDDGMDDEQLPTGLIQHPRLQYRWASTYKPCVVYEEAMAQGQYEERVRQMLRDFSPFLVAHIRHVTDIVMLLSPQYYNAGNHFNRIRVCWALRDEHPIMLGVWILFVMRRHQPVNATDLYYENDFERVAREWIPLWTTNRTLVRSVAQEKDGVSLTTLMHWARRCNELECVRLDRRFWGRLMELDIDGEMALRDQSEQVEELNPTRGKKRKRTEPTSLTEAQIARYLAEMFRGELITSGIPRAGSEMLPDVYILQKGGYWKATHMLTHEIQQDKISNIKRIIASSFKVVESLSEEQMELNNQFAGQPPAEQYRELELKVRRAMFQLTMYKSMRILLETGKKVKDIKSMLLPYFQVDYAEDKFNQQMHLFPFANGVFDVEQKLFRETSPEDLLTEHCGHVFLGSLLSQAEWDRVVRKEATLVELLSEFEDKLEDKMLPGLLPGAGNFRSRVERVRKYISQNFPQKAVEEYMMIVFACCLRGDHQMEQVLHYIYGLGKNGKSTFFAKFLKHVFGALYATAPHSLWSVDPDATKPNPFLVAMRRARIWVTAETAEDMCISPLALKANVGATDTSQARELFNNKIHEFIVQAMPFLVSNYMIRLAAVDFGMTRRFCVIEAVARYMSRNHMEYIPGVPKEYHFIVERIDDKELKCLAQVFLVLLVDIYLRTDAVLPDDTARPEEVRKSTAFFLNQRDPCGHFISMSIRHTQDAADHIGRQELNARFATWYQQVNGCITNDEKQKYSKQLGTRIDTMIGATAESMRTEWRGIAWKNDTFM